MVNRISNILAYQFPRLSVSRIVVSGSTATIFANPTNKVAVAKFLLKTYGEISDVIFVDDANNKFQYNRYIIKDLERKRCAV